MEWSDELQVYIYLCQVRNCLQEDRAFEVNFVLTVHIIEVISAEDYLFTQIYQLENWGLGSLGDLPKVTQDGAELTSHISP